MEAIAVRQTQSVWTYRVHSSVTVNRATQEVALTAQVAIFLDLGVINLVIKHR